MQGQLLALLALIAYLSSRSTHPISVLIALGGRWGIRWEISQEPVIKRRPVTTAACGGDGLSMGRRCGVLARREPIVPQGISDEVQRFIDTHRTLVPMHPRSSPGTHLRSKLFWVLGCLCIFWPGSARAQLDTAMLHGSLRGWAENAWLVILDRNGAFGGRTSDRGILQRFHEDIDNKYRLDLLSMEFSLADEYAWYQREQGLRWRAGSITKRDFATFAEVKASVPLGSAWSMGVRFDRVEIPEVSRNAVRVSFDHRLSQTTSVSAGTHLDPIKPGSDLETGVRWRSGGGAEITAFVTLLDLFNNLIYVDLNAADQAPIDSTLEYETRPVALRTSAVFPLGHGIRLEGYGAVMLPSTILSYEGRDRSSGFRQEERFAYGGAMVEWAPFTAVRTGAFVTYLRARTERAALSPGAGVNAYDLIESTTQVGGFVVTRLGRRWMIEHRFVRDWLPERRTYSDSAQGNVDYELRMYRNRTMVFYEAPGGFLLDLAVLLDFGDIVRGAGQVAGDPRSPPGIGDTSRWIFDIGWRFSDRAKVLLGGGWDAGFGWAWGGGRARLTAYW